MNEQTYLTYAEAVRDYLRAEWPDAASMTDEGPNACDTARRELVGVTLGQFMVGATVPMAAAIVASALLRLK